MASYCTNWLESNSPLASQHSQHSRFARDQRLAWSVLLKLVKMCGLESLLRTSMSALSVDSGIATAAANKGERRHAITATEGVFMLADLLGSLETKEVYEALQVSWSVGEW